MSIDSIDRSYAQIQVRYRVTSGFWPPEEIAETVLEECFDPAEVTSDDVAWVRQLIEQSFAAQREAERAWPAVTDWDKLATAFAALEATGVIALHNAGTTQSDGLDDINELYHDLGAEDSGVEGYCFYHLQDLERAIDGHGLMLAFGRSTAIAQRASRSAGAFARRWPGLASAPRGTVLSTSASISTTSSGRSATSRSPSRLDRQEAILEHPLLDPVGRPEATADEEIDALGGIGAVDGHGCPPTHVADLAAAADTLCFRARRGSDPSRHPS